MAARPSSRPGAGEARALPGPTPVLVGLLWSIWGSAFLLIKIGVGHAPSPVFVALRVGAATVAVAVVVWCAPGRSRDPRVHRYGVALGLTNVFGFLSLQTAGIAASDIGFSAVVIYTQPLLVALLARWWLRERLSARQVAGLALGWVGVAVAAAGELRVGAAHPVGVLLLLGGATSWALGAVLFSSMPRDVPVWDVLLWQNVYGLVPLVVVALVVGGPVDWGVPLLGSAALVGVGASAAGFALLFSLLRRGKAGVVMSWIFAVPVISAALGVAVRGEPLTPGLVVGGAAVGAALLMVSRTG